MQPINFNDLIKSLDFATKKSHTFTHLERENICNKIIEYVKAHKLDNTEYNELQAKFDKFITANKYEMLQVNRSDYVKKIYRIQKTLEKSGLHRFNIIDELSPIKISNKGYDINERSTSYVLPKDILTRQSEFCRSLFSNESKFCKEYKLHVNLSFEAMEAFMLLLDYSYKGTQHDIEKFYELCKHQSFTNILSELDRLLIKYSDFISIDRIVSLQTEQQNKDLFDFFLNKDDFELAYKVYAGSSKPAMPHEGRMQATGHIKISEEEKLNLIGELFSVNRTDLYPMTIHDVYTFMLKKLRIQESMDLGLLLTMRSTVTKQRGFIELGDCELEGIYASNIEDYRFAMMSLEYFLKVTKAELYIEYMLLKSNYSEGSHQTIENYSNIFQQITGMEFSEDNLRTFIWGAN